VVVLKKTGKLQKVIVLGAAAMAMKDQAQMSGKIKEKRERTIFSCIFLLFNFILSHSH
jgi:hypothetical protein